MCGLGSKKFISTYQCLIYWKTFMTRLTLYHDFGGRSILIRSGSLTMLERIFCIFHKLSLLKSLIFSSLRAPSSSLLLIRRLGDNFRDIVLPSTANYWHFNFLPGTGRNSTKYQDLILYFVYVMKKAMPTNSFLAIPHNYQGFFGIKCQMVGHPIIGGQQSL